MFRPDKSHKTGHRKICSDCFNEYRRKRYKNKNSQEYLNSIKKRDYHRKYFLFFVRRMYSYMQSRVRGQGNKSHYGHYIGIPLCDRKSFVKYAFRNWSLKVLFCNWQQSGYDKRKYPTPDRINNKLGYTFDNIQFLTLSDNVKKQFTDKQKPSCHQ